MKIVLFDLPENWATLLPLTFTRSISNIRMGLFTSKERWQKIFPECSIISLSAEYVNDNNFLDIEDEMLYINTSLLPDKHTIATIKKLDLHKGIHKNGQLLAYKGYIKYNEQWIKFPFAEVKFLIHPQNLHYQKALLQSEDIASTHKDILYLQYPYQIFQWNEQIISFDFENFVLELPKGLLSHSNQLIGPEKKLYISPKAKIEGSIVNTNTGYVFIDEDAEWMEGAMIRGPFVLSKNAVLKMGAKIYGATSIGPHCKVGGEVNNSVFFGYSNKAHDGFVGNSVVGEWCNLGADTNNSNLKNNYGEVKIFNYLEDKPAGTGSQFCGLIMGDHSKSGINTMFNTGTVVGVGCNVYGADFPAKHIPCFTWGGTETFEEYALNKLFYAAQEMMKRRHQELSEKDKALLSKIKEITEYHRKTINYEEK